MAANDANCDALTYTLSGPDAAHFRLEAATGQLKTFGALDFETKQTYQVTVTVRDAAGAEATAMVRISVTDLADQPPTPQNLTVGTVGEHRVALSWDTVAGAAKYRVEYQVDGTTTGSQPRTSRQLRPTRWTACYARRRTGSG